MGEKSDRTWDAVRSAQTLADGLACPAAVFFIMVPFVRENFILIALAILAQPGHGPVSLPPPSLISAICFSSEQRSKANGVINLRRFGGGRSVRRWRGDNVGVPLPFIVGAAVMLAAVVVVLIFVKEPRHVEQEEEPAPESGGVIENFREVWRQEDRSGVMILAAIFFWFVAWNAMEAFLRCTPSTCWGWTSAMRR